VYLLIEEFIEALILQNGKKQVHYLDKSISGSRIFRAEIGLVADFWLIANRFSS